MSKSKAKILSLPITNHANYNAETNIQIIMKAHGQDKR